MEDTNQLPVKTTGLKEGKNSLLLGRALNFHFALGPVNYLTSSAYSSLPMILENYSLAGWSLSLV